MARTIDRSRRSPTPERPVAPPAPPLFYRDGRKLDDAERGIAPPEDAPQDLLRLLKDQDARQAAAKAPSERKGASDQVFDIILLISDLFVGLSQWLTWRRLTWRRLIGAIVLVALVKGCLDTAAAATRLH
ncbi:hypothetical protein [Nevskia sp.]|uniref:hypothetical protein n=1 Tax=Nevskia sp. TaxID=1929292 RepID=UPI0025F5325A|nr:hypothetical protein [Nevskia sp.]